MLLNILILIFIIFKLLEKKLLKDMKFHNLNIYIRISIFRCKNLKSFS